MFHIYCHQGIHQAMVYTPDTAPDEEYKQEAASRTKPAAERN